MKPLSARRALHNSAGPDPDANSAPNSCGTAERTSRGYKTSGRPRNHGITTGTGVNKNDNGKESTANRSIVRESIVPYVPTISRKEILKKSSTKNDDTSSGKRFTDSLRRHCWVRSTIEIDDERIRPKTLPSLGKRLRAERDFKQVSRRDILRRRDSVDVVTLRATSHGGSTRLTGKSVCGKECIEVKGNTIGSNSSTSTSVSNDTRSRAARSAGSLQRSRWGKDEEEERDSKSSAGSDLLTISDTLRDINRGLVPRPSTLPKIVHGSRSSRSGNEDWCYFRSDPVKQEPPVYGRIRRRKTSLPVAPSFEDSSNSNTLSRYTKARKSSQGSRSNTMEAHSLVGKINRRLRNHPLPDGFTYRAKSDSNLPETAMKITDMKKNTIYAKVSRKTGVSRDVEKKNEPEASVHQAMSRRRIIQNAVQSESLDRRKLSRARNDRNFVRTNSDKICLRSNSNSNGEFSRYDVIVDQKRQDICRTSRIDPKNDYNQLDNSVWHKAHDGRYRSKSQSRLTEIRNSNRENLPLVASTTINRLSSTLPSYAKTSRKFSASSVSVHAARTEPQNFDDRRRRLSRETGTLSKLTKERSNCLKRSAGMVAAAAAVAVAVTATHARNRSETDTIARSKSSPVTTSSSIFGFCTGKRRVQANETNKEKTMNVEFSYPRWHLKTVLHVCQMKYKCFLFFREFFVTIVIII